MGGRVGLKGTDGKVEQAHDRGAQPRAPGRARAALDALADSGEGVELLTYGHPMGESVAGDAGFDPTESQVRAITRRVKDAGADGRVTMADVRRFAREEGVAEVDEEREREARL